MKELFWLDNKSEFPVRTNLTERGNSGHFSLERLRPKELSGPSGHPWPLRCILALVGWSYMYLTAAPLFIALGLVTLLAGSGAFLFWAWQTDGWPFGTNT